MSLDSHAARVSPRRLWRNAKIRSVIFQGLTLVLVAAAFAFIIHNAAVNIEKQNIASGFGFLNQTAGFDISFSLIDYDSKNTHGRVFLVGAINTLFVSALGIMIATFLGVIIGIARLSSNWIVARLALVYVEILRNTPLLLQIIFWYTGVFLGLPTVRNSLSIGEFFFINNRGVEIPKLIAGPHAGWVLLAVLTSAGLSFVIANWQHGRTRTSISNWWIYCVGLIIVPIVIFNLFVPDLSWEVPALQRFNFSGGISVPISLVALLLALSTYTAAFIAEIVRAGILAVDRGQREAAAALGLKPGQILRHVVLPQALRVIVPPLTSQYLNLMKNSSLALAATFPDIVNVFSGTSLNQTGQAVEVITLTMVFYLMISLLISMGMNIYNRQIALKGGRPV